MPTYVIFVAHTDDGQRRVSFTVPEPTVSTMAMADGGSVPFYQYPRTERFRFAANDAPQLPAEPLTPDEFVAWSATLMLVQDPPLPRLRHDLHAACVEVTLRPKFEPGPMVAATVECVGPVPVVDLELRWMTGADLAAYRQEHAGPVLAAFADWLAEQRPRVLPKSAIGEAITYASNQWHTLCVYLTDGRLAIDNAAAEQAIRPLCVGRRNWLHLGGDGGLTPTAVLLSIAASVMRHGLDPRAYLKHVLTELPARPACADLADLLPDR